MQTDCFERAKVRMIQTHPIPGLFLRLGAAMRTIRHSAKWVGLIVILASIWPLARASAWDDANTAPTKTLTTTVGLSETIDVTFDSSGNLYVLDYGSPKTINVYQAGHLNGHPAPFAHVVVDYAGIANSIAIDSNGNVYVSTYPVDGILVYDDIGTWAADGTSQPIKRLAYTAPLAISKDNSDNLYVVEAEEVNVYDEISTWLSDGSTQPSKTLVGNTTGLNSATSIALDDSDNMYVSNGGNNSITYYAEDWSDGDIAPSKTLIGNNTGLDAPGSIAFDASGKMFVSSGCIICGVAPVGSPKVLAFAANWTTGNTAPVKTLVGDRTRLRSSAALEFDDGGVLFATSGSGSLGQVIQFVANWADGNTGPSGFLGSLEPTGIAFDQAGRMYLPNYDLDSITVYEANWAEGQVQQVMIWFGANTGLSSPYDVSFDDIGNMYVANSPNDNGAGVSSVTVYAPDWSGGDTAPIKTLIGNNTGLLDPVSVTFDSDHNMYVLNYSSDSVTMYAAGWAGGDTAPIKTLIGANTGLDLPNDFAFDASGNLYVVNEDNATDNGNNTINVFASDWTDGDNAPIATLHGPATGLDNIGSVAIGRNGKIYVTNLAGDSVTVFGDFSTWASDGNTAPIKTLSGADTGLDAPWGIAFDALGNMYVGNEETVTMYAGEIPPPVTTTTTTTTPPTTTNPPTTTTPPAPEVFMLPATL